MYEDSEELVIEFKVAVNLYTDIKSTSSGHDENMMGYLYFDEVKFELNSLEVTKSAIG